MDLRFYLEMPWPPSMREQVPQRNDINLFFKYYDWQVWGGESGAGWDVLTQELQTGDAKGSEASRGSGVECA